MNLKLNVLVLLLVCSSSLYAATVGVVETFGDGGTPSQNGWILGSNGMLAANSGDGGMGDHAIDYGTSSGFHFFAPAMNAGTANPAFAGDYLAAGATAIQFQARHSGMGDTISLRATGFGDSTLGVDWFTTNTAVEISPNDTTWQTYQLPLDPAGMFSGGTNGFSPAEILSDVFQIGFRHDPAGTGPTSPAFVSTVTNIYFDDIVLVPEPNACAGLLVGGLFLFRRRRGPVSLQVTPCDW